jgi:hypothetical protein
VPFAATSQPVCPSCAPRATAPCARCGQDRPPAARWSEGPVCDSCYTAALRHRGPCASCGQVRRLVAPPGPDAETCAGCAGLPVTHACTDCGIEDKLYERGRCERCSLRRRATALLAGPDGQIPAGLQPVLEAICSARVPKSALNWLRRSHGANCSPAWPLARCLSPTRRWTPSYGAALPTSSATCSPRAACSRPAARNSPAPANGPTASSTPSSPAARQVVRAYATWQVMRRLRATAGRATRPRTYTARAHRNLRAATGFLTWLHDHGRALTDCGQADVDAWLATGPPPATWETS